MFVSIGTEIFIKPSSSCKCVHWITSSHVSANYWSNIWQTPQERYVGNVHCTLFNIYIYIYILLYFDAVLSYMPINEQTRHLSIIVQYRWYSQ